MSHLTKTGLTSLSQMSLDGVVFKKQKPYPPPKVAPYPQAGTLPPPYGGTLPP